MTLLFFWMYHSWLDHQETLFVFRIYTAFVQVNGGVLAAGTRKVVNEVEASQTSGAVLTVEFSYSPLGLHTHKQTNTQVQ